MHTSWCKTVQLLSKENLRFGLVRGSLYFLVRDTTASDSSSHSHHIYELLSVCNIEEVKDAVELIGGRRTWRHGSSMWSCTEHALRDHSVAHLTVVLQSQLQMTSVSIGEHSNNRWSGMGTPPEVLAKSSNVETWFEHVELYFRAAELKKSLSSIPVLKTKAGPRDQALWTQRLKEEYSTLIKYIEMNKENDTDWFRLESDSNGTRWFELDGLTPKMFRGGKICLSDHFKPLWSRNVPKFGIAHAFALGLAPWLAVEVPELAQKDCIKPSS
ncbi:Ubiquitin-fold modifier-conjugating enzyme [Trichinella spiralis]|uniref:Ubiquitin-fold modifier-conjugating enzyme 1 n=1 Tax=Trichinella spiralis TaxID=6334 RepID=A0ABR3KK60_TRISP